MRRVEVAVGLVVAGLGMSAVRVAEAVTPLATTEYVSTLFIGGRA